MELSNVNLSNVKENQSLSSQLLTWYTTEKRDLPWRKTKDPYAIWVSEVMLQQTQVKTVIPYYERFLDRFPSVKDLGTSSLEDVLTIWSGLGYYSRARRMWEGAKYLIENLGGKIPGNYEELLRIPGIGDYTAGALASIAFGQRAAAIDGNVKRVVSRLLAWPDPVELTSSYRHFRDRLLAWQSALKPGDFNQALMELGAMICTPAKPDCSRCPLGEFCKGYLQGDFLRYPIKKLKPRPLEVTRWTFVLRKGDRLYIQKRPSNGLLADLWEFPGVELNHDNADCLKDDLPTISMDICYDLFRQVIPESEYDSLVKNQFEEGIKFYGPVWYTFSHRRWKIIWAIIDLSETLKNETTYDISLRELDGEYRMDSGETNRFDKGRWVSVEDLRSIPLPVAFKTIRQTLERMIK